MNQKLEPIGDVFCKGGIELGTGCKRCGRCAVALAARVQELEKSESHLIRRRDEMDAAINQIADAVLGSDRHEWSSQYDYQDAAIEIECRVQELEAQRVPEGWQLVPIEPTPEMWQAVNKLDDEMMAGDPYGHGCSIEQAWHCLLAAAPQPECQWESRQLGASAEHVVVAHKDGAKALSEIVRLTKDIGQDL